MVTHTCNLLILEAAEGPGVWVKIELESEALPQTHKSKQQTDRQVSMAKECNSVVEYILCMHKALGLSSIRVTNK